MPNGAKKPRSPGVPSDKYSFPIFDAAFARAVIVRQSDGGPIRFDDNGNRVRTSFEQHGSALIYRRIDGHWKKVDNQDLYWAD